MIYDGAERGSMDWIPVATGRLPEKEDDFTSVDVMVTLEDGQVVYAAYSYFYGHWFGRLSGCEMIAPVIAWQPLPKAYMTLPKPPCCVLPELFTYLQRSGWVMRYKNEVVDGNAVWVATHAIDESEDFIEIAPIRRGTQAAVMLRSPIRDNGYLVIIDARCSIEDVDVLLWMAIEEIKGHRDFYPKTDSYSNAFPFCGAHRHIFVPVFTADEPRELTHCRCGRDTWDPEKFNHRLWTTDSGRYYTRGKPKS